MHLRYKNKANSSLARRKRFSPLMLVGLSIPIILVLIASAVLILPHLGSRADTVNMNCTLLVPANPLTATGLATPYQFSATDQANGACNENNVNQSAFVQGVIFDPTTGTFKVYSPLVIDGGTQPAIAPSVPILPVHAIVGLWFGFNGTLLTLQGTDRNTLQHSHCVNGLPGSVFGQFAYCNAPNFFAAVHRAIVNGQVQVPALGTTTNGLPCPSVRSFGVADMDQSDNVQTQYLATVNGQIAQLSAANQIKFQNSIVLGNPSDNALVTHFIDPAVGCHPWQAPNLVDANTFVSALPLDELQAAAFQQAPIAEIPAGDEMALDNNNPSLTKVNAYRRGVDQTLANTLNVNPANPVRSANTTVYCQNLINTGIPILQQEMGLTQNAASPMPAVANSLFTFLANRLNATLGAGGLNCVGLLNTQNPVTLTTDGNGVVTAATLTTTPGAATSSNSGTPTTSPTPNVGTIPTMGTSTTPTVPSTNPTVLPTPTTGVTPTPIPATPSPTTGTTPTPTVPAASPTATPTPGAGG